MKLFILGFIAAVLSFPIVRAQPLAVTVNSQTNVAVNGESTGSVTLAATGGSAPYQFSKDGINFQSSATFGSLRAGNYIFTVRDALAAKATVNTTISQVSALSVSIIAQSNVGVAGQSTGSVTLMASGGTAPYQYSKDGVVFQSSATFGSLQAGNYTFTAKDALSNRVTVNAFISQSNTLIVFATAQTDVSVIGESTGSVTLAGAGGTIPYVYSKDGLVFQSSPTFSSLGAGNYVFTIRDAAFNTSSISLTVNQPEPLNAVIASKTNVTINGQQTGAVTLSASGGTPPYQFAKDGAVFQSSAVFSSLPAGEYTFTVKDAASATLTLNATIEQPPILVLSLDSKVDVVTYGQSTGVVTLSAAGGVPPYQFSKDGISYQNDSSFSSLAAGNYTFVLKDAASASSTINVSITSPAFDLSNIKPANNFTPNGDGVNDTWQVENIDLLPSHTLKIFDRAGRIVYTIKDYKNNWDGTTDGLALAEGTYYYAFTFDTPGLGVKKGFITLVK